MPLDFPNFDATSYDPERTVGDEARRVVVSFPASEVAVVYYSRDGKRVGVVPADGDQTDYHFQAYAPGVSPIAVEKVRFGMLDAANDGRHDVEVTFIEYKKGEHKATPADEARRLELLALFRGLVVPDEK